MRTDARHADRLLSAIEESRVLRRNADALIAQARLFLKAPPDLNAVLHEATLARANAKLHVAAAQRITPTPPVQ
jgi:hypothetical protein